MANANSNASQATGGRQARLPVNPDAVFRSSPLIGYHPDDTWTNVDAVLAVLQEYCGIEQTLDITEESRHGIFIMMHAVRDAIQKQAEALKSGRAKQ